MWIFPEIKQCIMIYITLPPETCTLERSFGTHRRVKIRLKSITSG